MLLAQRASLAASWPGGNPRMLRSSSTCRSMAPAAVEASWEAAVHTMPSEQAASCSDHALLGEERVMMQQQATTSYVQALSVLNESTKWGVSFLVCGVLAWRHDCYAAWCVLGAIVSSFLCKVLKHVINQERPGSARKLDPGMPSSHANSLNFLSAYAAMGLLSHSSHSVAAWALSLAVLAAGIFLVSGTIGITKLLGAASVSSVVSDTVYQTWLRVALGFHTLPQVLVGGLLGASTAASWLAMGTHGGILAVLQAWGPGLPLLYTLTGLAMAAFAIKNVWSWLQEQKLKPASQSVYMQETQLVLG